MEREEVLNELNAIREVLQWLVKKTTGLEQELAAQYEAETE